MMRAYNSKIIPKIRSESDKYYIADIERDSPSKYLSDKQIRKLIEEHRGIDDDFLVQQMVRHFGRYVISIAKNYQERGLSLGDLISEGLLGLIKAVERFDLTTTTKFVTYSNTIISRYMREALDYNNNIVKLPKNIRNERMKTREVVKVMQMKGKNDAEIIERLGDTTNLRYFLNPELYNKTSLSAPIHLESKISVEDTLVSEEAHPDSRLNKLDIKKEFNNLIKRKLTKNEGKIIRIFFGIGQTYPITSYKDIAKKLSIPKADVKIMKESAIQKLREADSIEILTQFRYI